MSAGNILKNVKSHSIGLSVAGVNIGLVVLLLHCLPPVTAQDKSASQSQTVDQLAAKVNWIFTKHLPNKSPDKAKVLAAILELGEGTDQIEKRVQALSMAAIKSDVEYGAAAEQSFEKLGDAVIPVFEKMIQSDQRRDLVRACAGIRALGKQAKVFAPRLVELAGTGDYDQRSSVAFTALFALQNVGAAARPAMPAIIEIIKDAQNFNAQVMACRVCVSLGPDAAPAAEALADLAESGNISTKSWASMALGAIGPVENVDTVGILSKKLSAFSYHEKTRALIGLAYMRDEAFAASEQVLGLMNDPASKVQPQAAYAYYRITDETDRPVKTLISLLENVNNRGDALLFLEKIGPDAAAATDALIPLLGASEVSLREGAVLALGSIGNQAASAIEPLKKLLNDPDPLLAQNAARAIQAIQTNDLENNKSDRPVILD